ncbi:hypothetical protein [Jatrophihabitans sp.]|uniref:hypothetical protein n=1 Tax=Jatrophihabitans sp. TaxID=1932789 RepID=UPI0030C66C7D|nr:rane protein [Jatrophihabitans sp.]
MRIDDVIELRVHGVSGTPPEELLDRPLVDLVAGDGTAGFYRPHLEAEAHDDVPIGAAAPAIRGPLLEGYVWGGLTSGAPSRAFWLLLMPFTLGNVAPRLRPAACGPRRVWLIWYLSRLLALTLTLVLVAAFVGVGVDLIGWQCGAAAGRCANASPGWLFVPVTQLGTGRRVLVGGLVPVLGLLVLWLLSHRTISQNESVLPAAGGTAEGAADDIEPVLRSRWMWDNERPVRRLGALHVQTGLAATLAMTGAVTRGAWQWVDGLLGLAVLGYAAVALACRSFTSHEHVTVDRWHERGLVIWGALLVAAAGTAWWLLRCDDLPTDPRHCTPAGCLPAGLPHFGETIVWLLLAELGLVLGLALLVARRRLVGTAVLGEPGPKTGLLGMGTAVMALLGVFLASVFTAGTYLFAGAWLTSGSVHPRLSTVTAVSRIFAVPEAILDAGLAYSLAVALLVLMVLLFGLRVLAAWLRLGASGWLMVPGAFSKDYPTQPTDPRRSPRTKTVLRDLFVGRIVDVLGGLLGVITLVGALLTYAFGVLLLLEHALHIDGGARWLVDPARRSGGGGAPAFFSRVGLQGKGAYLAVATLVLLVVLGAAAFRVARTRRSVGILWDLASFWPRVSHPLAPPCYAERTVPELVNRISWHSSQGRGVVLAGHSQGTVISAATVLQLGDVADDIALLTFGCVLRRLYGRYFPAYFDARVLRQVGEAVQSAGVPRWWNLWRYSDYLGGPILAGPPPIAQPAWDPALPLPSSPGPCVDLHLVDPPYERAPGNPSEPAALRHSDFPKVPQFQQAVVGLAALIGSAGGPGTVGPTA